MHNLLAERIITVDLTDGRRRTASLPELFVLLEENRVSGFARLLPHQRHSWHALLVQLACLALEGSPLPDPEESPCLLGRHDADFWAGALRRLAPGHAHDEPWSLVVEDCAKPAFLQPPVTDGPPAGWGHCKESPDDLDVLVTSKNHGVKQARMNAPTAEDWLFALVSVQTHGGYAGGQLYGIARQNGGYGTRAGFSLVAGLAPGGQWARDARVILDNPAELAPDIFLRPRRALLWLEPWDGKSSWPLRDLHPLFVEICRRIRLEAQGDSLLAFYKSSKGTRLEVKETKGNLSDPWIPVHVKEDKAYGLAPTYRNLSFLLGKGEYKPPLLMRPHPCDPSAGMALQCRILLRGKGGTDGYRERLIPVAGPPALLGMDKTGEMAERMIHLAKRAEYNVLGPALKAFLRGGTSRDAGSRDAAASALHVRAMDGEVDEAFFPALWEMLERQEGGADNDDVEQIWIDRLRQLAEEHFEAGLSALPCAAVFRLRAETEARMLFERLRAKELPRAANGREKNAEPEPRPKTRREK